MRVEIMNEHGETFRYSDKYEDAYFPLPWGIMKGCFLIKGNPYSSAGGRWYYKLPEEGKIGYGQYRPYYEFLFKGNLYVQQKENADLLQYPDTWGWRADQRKWIYIIGEVSPIPEWIFEKELTSLEIMKGNCIAKQGNLQVFSVNIDKNLLDLQEKGKMLRQIRGKVFNHQIFEKIGSNWRLFYIQKQQWIMFVYGEAAYITSRHHLENPLSISKGVYILEHPMPSSGSD